MGGDTSGVRPSATTEHRPPLTTWRPRALPDAHQAALTTPVFHGHTCGGCRPLPHPAACDPGSTRPRLSGTPMQLASCARYAADRAAPIGPRANAIAPTQDEICSTAGDSRPQPERPSARLDLPPLTETANHPLHLPCDAAPPFRHGPPAALDDPMRCRSWQSWSLPSG